MFYRALSPIFLEVISTTAMQSTEFKYYLNFASVENEANRNKQIAKSHTAGNDCFTFFSIF